MRTSAASAEQYNFTQIGEAEQTYMERWLITFKEERKSNAEILTRSAQSVPSKSCLNIPMSQHLRCVLVSALLTSSTEA